MRSLVTPGADSPNPAAVTLEATAGAVVYSTCGDDECGSWNDDADSCTVTAASGEFAPTGSGRIDISPLEVAAEYGDYSNVVFFGVLKWCHAGGPAQREFVAATQAQVAALFGTIGPHGLPHRGTQ